MYTRPAQSEVAQLATAAAEGDSAAWKEIVTRYRPFVHRVAHSYGLSLADADDVSQETLLALFTHIRCLHSPERLASWLAVTARHEALRLLRRAKREVLVDEPDQLDPAGSCEPEVDQALLTAERDAELWRAIAWLPSRRQRLIRALMADPQPSYRQIAEELGMPIGAIGPTRRRCLESLRRLLHSGADSAAPRSLALEAVPVAPEPGMGTRAA